MSEKQHNLDLFSDGAGDVSDLAEAVILHRVNVEEVLDASDGNGGEALNRPPKRVDFFKGTPAEFDGKDPLANPRHEQMLQFCLDGDPQYVAYQRAGHRNSTRKTAMQQASRVFRRPEVQARLRYLIAERKGVAKTTENTGRMTRAEKIRELERAMRSTALSWSDRLNAMKMHNALTGDGGEGNRNRIVDPAVLMDYLRNAAEQGRDPLEMAQEDTDLDDEEGEGAAAASGLPGAFSGGSEDEDPQDVVFEGSDEVSGGAEESVSD